MRTSLTKIKDRPSSRTSILVDLKHQELPIMEGTNNKIPSHMGCATGLNLKKLENDDYKLFDNCAGDAEAKW
jgi:hypothetical protein